MAERAIHEILSTNLKWLMEQHKGEIDSTPKIADKSKGLVSQRTAARAVAGTDSNGKPAVTTTESLVGFATAYGVQPWELLHPDFPVIHAQRKLSLEEKTEVQQIRERIAQLSEAAQLELFGNSETVKELSRQTPTTNERLIEKGWSAAGKGVSRKVG